MKVVTQAEYEVMKAEFEANVSQPVDLPFLSLAERQAEADQQHSPCAKAAHTTQDETEFIASLETNNRGTLEKKLRGYLAGCEKRVRWDSIEKEQAIAAATARLQQAA